MRFSEIINEAQHGKKGRHADIQHFDSPGYFTVGDSHSNGVGAYGDGPVWKAMGMDGAPSTNSMHISAINRIPKGSVVAISLGANDLGKKGKPGIPIPQIVSRVNSIINRAQSKGLTVVYLLPTLVAKDQPPDPRREELRDALNSAVTVPVFDLGRASVTDPMRLHLTSTQYSAIGERIAAQYKVKPQLPEPGSQSK